MRLLRCQDLTALLVFLHCVRTVDYRPCGGDEAPGPFPAQSKNIPE